MHPAKTAPEARAASAPGDRRHVRPGHPDDEAPAQHLALAAPKGKARPLPPPLSPPRFPHPPPQRLGGVCGGQRVPRPPVPQSSPPSRPRPGPLRLTAAAKAETETMTTGQPVTGEPTQGYPSSCSSLPPSLLPPSISPSLLAFLPPSLPMPVRACACGCAFTSLHFPSLSSAQITSACNCFYRSLRAVLSPGLSGCKQRSLVPQYNVCHPLWCATNRPRSPDGTAEGCLQPLPKQVHLCACRIRLLRHCTCTVSRCYARRAQGLYSPSPTHRRWSRSGDIPDLAG